MSVGWGISSRFFGSLGLITRTDREPKSAQLLVMTSADLGRIFCGESTITNLSPLEGMVDGSMDCAFNSNADDALGSGSFSTRPNNLRTARQLTLPPQLRICLALISRGFGRHLELLPDPR